MGRVFIGVSWPYANGPIHIGQFASTYLPADIFARFHRLRGDEVLMVSGSDMHGTPILVRAEADGTTPGALAARFHEVHRSTFERAGVTFDLYTHTETLNHEQTVREVFLALLEHGYVRRRTEEGPYCPKHRRFLPDRYALGACPHCGFPDARGDECDHCGRPIDVRQLGSPRCALCGTPAEFRPSEHFFLELDKLEGAIVEFLAARPHWRAGTRRVAENFLTEGLHPTSITRDLDWGVPIPLDGYDGKRFYVWFEALIGYLSASREWAIRAQRPEAWQRYWDPAEPVRQFYFVGKDNRFQHTLVWPGMLIGAGGLQLPYDVPANEWMLLGGEKLSKSRSKALDVFLPSMLDRYPSDVVRFYPALLAPQNRDTEFDSEEFERLWEEILSNQYGNLAQRALVLARDRHGGRIPAPTVEWAATRPSSPGARLAEAHRKITAEYEAVRLKEALDLTLEEVRAANRAFHESKPWALPPAEQAEALFEAIWRLHALAIWLSPVLPASSERLFQMLGYSEGAERGSWDSALVPPPSGQLLGAIEPLFPRPTAPAQPAGFGSEPLAPLAIRAGVIRGAALHPDAERLLVLSVDLGESQPRTVVAGIRASYAPEELVGRRIVVLANLAPRTIRKMTSQGMLLASESEGRAVLLEPPESVAPGTPVEGVPDRPPEITIGDFAKTPLIIAESSPVDGRRSVRAGGRTIEIDEPVEVTGLVVVRLEAPGSNRGRLVTFGAAGPLRPSAPVPAGAAVR
ncbi:MAG: methionine--tRNA ligase [Thermoplasmata archaeon]